MLQREFLKPFGGGGAGSRRAPHPVRGAGRGGIADPSVPRSPLSRPPPASPFSPPEPSPCRTECPRSSPGPIIIEQANCDEARIISTQNRHALAPEAGGLSHPRAWAPLPPPQRSWRDPTGHSATPAAGRAPALGSGRRRRGVWERGPLRPHTQPPVPTPGFMDDPAHPRSALRRRVPQCPRWGSRVRARARPFAPS